MRRYEVYSSYGMAEIRADRMQRQYVNDKAVKILFIIKDDIVAEFYCDRICGWAERREENDKYTGNRLAEGLRAKPG